MTFGKSIKPYRGSKYNREDKKFLCRELILAISLSFFFFFFFEGSMEKYLIEINIFPSSLVYMIDYNAWNVSYILPILAFPKLPAMFRQWTVVNI